MKDILMEKGRGKVTNEVLLLHDNVTAHRAIATQKKLAYLGFQYLDHQSCSPDLAPLDYHLFPGMKNQLKGRHFFSEAEVISAAETCLNGQNCFFFVLLAKLRATG
jgi:histone-lysine N-methyltransferase SETMAR